MSIKEKMKKLKQMNRKQLLEAAGAMEALLEDADGRLRKLEEINNRLEARILEIRDTILFRQAEDMGTQAFENHAPVGDCPYDEKKAEQLYFTWRHAWFTERARHCNAEDVEALTRALLNLTESLVPDDDAAEYTLRLARNEGISEVWVRNYFEMGEDEHDEKTPNPQAGNTPTDASEEAEDSIVGEAQPAPPAPVQQGK